MKKTPRMIVLLCIGLMLLSGCVSRPPASLILSEPEDPSMLVSADPSDASRGEQTVCLYFRYGETGYLAAEERKITVPRDQSLETALAEALIAGPSATSPALSPLFPPAVKVLAASRQGDTLFLTFNEALLGSYGDEPGREELMLRRRLCMDALAATLTERGLCVRVQVLIYPDQVQSASMRLTQGYFTLEKDAAIAPPLTRREETLLTPHNAAQMLLNAWMRQDWAGLYALTGQEDRPAEAAALNDFSLAPALTGFLLSHGHVSADGQTALLTAQISLQGNGKDETIENYPLLLRRQGGLWKMPYDRLRRMMNQE